MKIFVIFFAIALYSEERICGNAFKNQCAHQFDNPNTFNFASIQKNDFVFVKASHLHYFFSFIHPKIPTSYVLITHNYPSEIPGRFAPFLEDPKLTAWFGTNLTASHRKLFPLPLGFRNPDSYSKHDLELEKWHLRSQTSSRDILLYLNFNEQTSPERSFLRALFKGCPFCFFSERKPFEKYLEDLTRSRFVLSPRGYGIDCYRTWEAILMGAIPIVKSSPIDLLFEDLPVLIVSDWGEISEEYLVEKEREIRTRPVSWEKLYPSYWLRFRNSFKI